MGKRFTFADAKKRILDLEDELAKVQQKAGDVILDTKDNVFTNKELKKIRFLELWSICVLYTSPRPRDS